MSVENVKAFYAKLEADRALQKKVNALNELARKDPDKAIAELVKIGLAEGFEFTVGHYAEARTQSRKELLVAGEDELPDVSGQCGLPNDCPANWACTRTSNI